MNRDMTGQYKDVCLLPDMYSNTCIFLFRCSSCALVQRKCFIFPQPQNFKQHADVRIMDPFSLLHRLCLYNVISVSPNVISQSCRRHLQSNLSISLTGIINGMLCLWYRSLQHVSCGRKKTWTEMHSFLNRRGVLQVSLTNFLPTLIPVWCDLRLVPCFLHTGDYFVSLVQNFSSTAIFFKTYKLRYHYICVSVYVYLYKTSVL
jgi:hypothetical protein